MTGLAITAALVLSLGHGEIRYAVRYDPGLMAAMALQRGVPAAPCHFAHPTLPIGARARIRGLITGHEEVCTEADTSQDIDTTGMGRAESDRQRHIRLRRVELGYDEALRICGAWWKGNARECPVVFQVIDEEE